jgi:hypothetical protein
MFLAAAVFEADNEPPVAPNKAGLRGFPLSVVERGVCEFALSLEGLE